MTKHGLVTTYELRWIHD